MIQTRRYLHAHPELSGSEFETTQFLVDKLRELDVQFRIGPDDRGIIVDLGNPEAKRRLAIRADIDAIPVHDSKTVDYRSKVDSVMHACGHDAHSTILLGVVVSLHEFLAVHQPDIAVRAIFQPEEETAQGAKRMIEFGALENVQAIIGAHVDPRRAVGTVGIRPGVVTAYCTEVIVQFSGRGGHAARPHETIDPVAAAAQFVTQCNATIPRNVDALDPFVLTFTCINGGQTSNVIPDEVEIKGTLRTLSEESRQRVFSKVKEIGEGIAHASGVSVDVDFGLIVPSVIADLELTRLAERTCKKLLGESNVSHIEKPSMGGEDFAFYSTDLPAAFIRLGCAGPTTGSIPLHNSGFDIDERVLAIGAKIMASIAVDYFELGSNSER